MSGHVARALRTGLDMASAERAGGVLAKGAVNTVTRDIRGRIWAALWDKWLFVLDPEGRDFKKLTEIGQHDNPMRILELENRPYGKLQRRCL